MAPLPMPSSSSPNGRSHRSPKNVVSFLSGATSGCLSTLTLQPLDVVKTRMQMSAAYNRSVHLQTTLTLQPNASAFDTFRGIIRQDRVTGLWRGVTPSVMRNTIGVGLYFMTLNAITARLSSPDGTLSDLATLSSGAAARSISVILLCPLSVVKTRMETVEYAAKYHNVSHAVRTIAAEEGTRGLFAGLLPAIVRDAPYSAMYMLIYLRTKDFLGKAIGIKHNRSTIMVNPQPQSQSHPQSQNVNANTNSHSSITHSASSSSSSSPNAANLTSSPSSSSPSSATAAASTNSPPPASTIPNQQSLIRLVNFASGAFGGGLATLLTQPQDVVKTRMQLSMRSLDGKPSRYSTVTEAARRVFNEEGVYGFFRGASPRFMKRILGSAITWMVFEEVNSFFTKLIASKSSSSSSSSSSSARYGRSMGKNRNEDGKRHIKSKR